MIQSSKQVPFFTSSHQTERYGAQISERINAIIRKGSFILGDEVKLLEDQLSRFTGIKHAIGVANGSDALYLCLNALDLPEGSEVITTPFTFFASVSCITRNRLVPKFVDVNKDTCNIAPDRIESKITGKTAAILPVDLFCQTADMEPVRRLADKYNLKLIEDSAEAFGMKYQNQHAGKLADLSVLSFFPTKTLSCYGDGGMVLTDNDELAVKIRKLRSHGASKKYYHEYVGINSRLDELQAGILNIKMK